MRILNLKTKNFKRLRGDREYDFPDGIIGITGPNGSGKSTIMNAIGWCLYGPDMIPGGKANVVSWAAKEASVQVTFELDGRSYAVSRRQSTNGTGDASLHAGDDLLATGLDPTTRTVAELLGIDRTGFLSSVYSRQEELAGLSSLTPSNRMKTVMKLRGISKLTDAIESVRAQTRTKRSSLNFLRHTQPQLSEIKQKIAQLTKESANLQNAWEAAGAGLENLEFTVAETQRRQADLVEQVRAFRTYRESYEWADHAVQYARQALQRAQRAATAPEPSTGTQPPEPVEGRLWALRAARSDLQSQPEVGTVCPCCHRPYDDADAIATHQAERSVRLQQLAFDIAEEEDKVAAWERWRAEQQVWDNWNEAKLNSETEISDLSDELDEAIVNRDSIPEEYDVSDELADVRSYLSAYQQQQTQISIEKARIEERLVANAEALAEARRTMEKAEASSALESEVVTLDTTATELARMKETLIGQMIPALNAASSSLLTEMTDGRYTEMRLTPDYDIQYLTDSGWRGFETLSGGEQDVFALALRLALSSLSAERVGVLFLDEVMESLDPDRQEAVWQSLNRLTKKYNQIFLVTHVPEFRDRSPFTIAV